VIVILCCVSAAGFTREGWLQQYSAGWVGSQGLIARISGFIVGGASFIEQGLGLIGLEGSQVHGFLQTVITVVIVSFAATTMDSATRIQRYVVSELGGALGTTRFRGAHLPTLVAVGSGAALAMLVRAPGSTVIGSGGLTLWPIFGVTNQLLACLTFLVLTVWLAKRGKPVWATLLPLLFLVVTVSWAAVAQIRLFARTPGTQAHLIAILVVGLVLEGWMIVEGCLALGRARRGAAGIGADGVIRAAA
jgi:carbon starvation protein